jgi:hypothetical protein
MLHIRRAFPLFVFLFVLAACDSSTGSTGTATTPTPTPTPSPTASPSPKHFGQSAESLLAGLKSKGLPIGASFTYTAENDLNHLLGRPGQYTGKLNFKDTRITSTEEGPAISVTDGGSIEVFGSVSDATKRFTYLQALSTSGNALFAEYEYLDGVAILRVSTKLTPDQASAYKTALQALP